MRYWETPEFVAARREDAALYAAWCATVDYRNLPPMGTQEYDVYHRDIVGPAKAEWWEARQKLNALRAAGAANEAGERPADHALITDVDGDPVCSCGFDPARDPSLIEDRPISQWGAVGVIQQHIMAVMS